MRLILVLLFYLVITPIGVITRLFGKDFLDRRIEKDKGTYWIPRKRAEMRKERYETQF